jgi:HSP20 family molecular chaperone IbpA
MYSLLPTLTPLRLRLSPGAFDRRFGVSAPVVTSAWKDGALELTVDLPGVPRDAVDVSVAGRTLSIGVQTENLSWQRRLTLGTSLDPEQVTAQYTDGRLTVVVGRVAEAEPRRIEIDTASAPAIEAGDQPEAEQDTSSTG